MKTSPCVVTFIEGVFVLARFLLCPVLFGINTIYIFRNTRNDYNNYGGGMGMGMPMGGGMPGGMPSDGIQRGLAGCRGKTSLVIRAVDPDPQSFFPPGSTFIRREKLEYKKISNNYLCTKKIVRKFIFIFEQSFLFFIWYLVNKAFKAGSGSALKKAAESGLALRKTAGSGSVQN